MGIHQGVLNNLALVDYKTSIGTQEFDLQLQVYAEAGIREGLTVRGAFEHDLGTDARMTIDISPAARATAVAQVTLPVEDIRARKFGPNPSESKCQMCDVRALCQARAAEPKPVRVPKGPTSS
jgi:DNA helicase-2/ATP-dependent DNA helicase PcrA